MNRRREILKYRWEFMRRSREYWKAWRRATKIRKSVQSLLNDERLEGSDKESIYRAMPQYQEELKIAEAFGLTYMYDPTLSFDEIAGEDIFRLSLPEGRSYYPGGVDSIVTRMKSFDRLQIEIDFNRVGSIEALEGEIKFRLAAHWNLYRNNAARSEPKRLKDFDTILKAGDLEGRGYTQREIALELEPEAADQENVRNKVRYYLARYSSMIAGEYKKLTYP